MKKIKGKILRLGLSLFMLAGAFALPAQAERDHVRPQTVQVASPGRTIRKGDSFELKAKVTPYDADDDYLEWKIITGENVVRFDDEDRYDDEMEFRALKAGTAKISCQIRGTDIKSVVTVKVKKAASGSKITRVGAKERTVRVSGEFELEVKKKRGVREEDLKWSIEDRTVAEFDDDDIYDDEMEFRALKAGTTKIKCTHRRTKKSVTFIVHVENVIPGGAAWR